MSKRVPRFGSLSQRMPAPIRSRSLFAIARPSPVPPYLRSMIESCCVKGSNSRLRYSSVIPMPVSATVMRMVAFHDFSGSCGTSPSCSLTASMRTETDPRSVNFSNTVFGRRSVEWNSRSRAFSSAAKRKIWESS